MLTEFFKGQKDKTVLSQMSWGSELEVLSQHCSCFVAKLYGSGPRAVNPVKYATVFRKEVDIL